MNNMNPFKTHIYNAYISVYNLVSEIRNLNKIFCIYIHEYFHMLGNILTLPKSIGSVYVYKKDGVLCGEYECECFDQYPKLKLFKDLIISLFPILIIPFIIFSSIMLFLNNHIWLSGILLVYLRISYRAFLPSQDDIKSGRESFKKLFNLKTKILCKREKKKIKTFGIHFSFQ